MLELLQVYAPGRHARLEDFIVDALAICAGFTAGAGADFATRRLRWNTTPT
jgi:VanZ family protein